MTEADARLRGIALMIGAFATFTLVDATAKYMAESLAMPQIIFARYFVALLFTLAFFLPGRGTDLFRTGKPGLQVLRGLLLLLTTLLNFTALRFLQLAETATIMFAIPLFVCALSVPLLGERVGPRRWSAVIVGFIGVLIVIRPGFGALHWAAFISLSSALSAALFQLLTRRAAAHDKAETTLFYSTAVGSVLILPAAPFGWTMPDGLGLGLMLAIGFFGAFGHYLLIRAHHLAPAPVLAPFSYSQIIWMVGLGYLVFGDIPDAWTLLGGAVVIGSGLYLWHRERRLALLSRSVQRTRAM